MAVDFSALDAVIEHMDHVDYSAWSAKNRDALYARYLSMESRFQEQYSFEEYVQYMYEDHKAEYDTTEPEDFIWNQPRT